MATTSYALTTKACDRLSATSKQLTFEEKRLLFLRQSFIDVSTTNAKLTLQSLHVYAIHRRLNACKQLNLQKAMADRVAEKGRTPGA